MVDGYKLSWLVRIDAGVIVSVLFVLMLLSIGVGLVIGKSRKEKNYLENPSNYTIYGAVLGLLAFLLAFTFGMSGNRYDNRRLASIREANDIGTAILRADLYPDSDRVAFRNNFKQYLQARIDNITAGMDERKLSEANNQAAGYSDSLWKHAMEFSRKNPDLVVISGQMVPALNNMFDSANSNTYHELMRVPESIVIMLFLLSLVAAFFVGYESVEKGVLDWYIGVGFCLLTCMVIFITLDLDRPRRGFIKLETSNEAIISLKKQFGKMSP